MSVKVVICGERLSTIGLVLGLLISPGAVGLNLDCCVKC